MAGRLSRRALCLALPFLALLITSGYAWVAGAEEAEDAARAHFLRGRQLERQGDLVGALDAYAEAQALRPVFRLYRHRGRVCKRLGRYREAIDAYQRFLSEGADQVTQRHREAAVEAIAELRGLVATLHVAAPVEAEVFIDGVRIETVRQGEPITVDPGAHDVVIERGGRREYQTEVTLQSGETYYIDAGLGSPRASPTERSVGGALEAAPSQDGDGAEPREIEPRGSRRRAHRGLFWSSLGLSAAALVGGTVLGVLALLQQRRFDELDDPARDDALDVELREVGRRGEALAVSTDVLLGTGAALAVAAIVLALFTDFDGVGP